MPRKYIISTGVMVETKYTFVLHLSSTMYYTNIQMVLSLFMFNVINLK